MIRIEAPRAAPASEGALMTRAVLRAAAHLGVPQNALSRIIGVSEASVSRMSAGTHALEPGDKPYELAVLFVRTFRGLDAMVGGDEAVARLWLRNSNLALGDAPLTLMQSVTGLVHVVAYLDAHRARV
ncbi:MAG: antitoxin Xre/MbcA/ParS toxin-binding domain-containing protein [Acidobacteriota bacterium]